MEYKQEHSTLTFDVKYAIKADDDGGTVTGHAAIFGNIDSDGEIIEKGAFTKTLQERIPRGMVKFLSGHNAFDLDAILGTVIEAHEDDHGLAFTAKLSQAPTAQDVKVKMLEGHINRLSIGFNVLKQRFEKDGNGNSIRFLEELKLWEISAVGFPANEMATIESVKSMIPFNNLDIAPIDTPFDPDGAAVRVKRWSGNSDAKNMMAHMDIDTDTGEGIYPIADVIDNELVLIPKAVFALMSTVKDNDTLHYLKGNIDKYYAKMRDVLDTDVHADWDSKFIKPIRSLDTTKSEAAEPIRSLTAEARKREIELKLVNLELTETIINGL